jgi:hypothetical protein
MNDNMVTKEQLLIAKDEVLKNIDNGLFIMRLFRRESSCGTQFCIGGTMEDLGYINLNTTGGTAKMPDVIRMNLDNDSESYLFFPTSWNIFSDYAEEFLYEFEDDYYTGIEGMSKEEQKTLVSRVIDDYIEKYYGETT